MLIITKEISKNHIRNNHHKVTNFNCIAKNMWRENFNPRKLTQTSWESLKISPNLCKAPFSFQQFHPNLLAAHVIFFDMKFVKFVLEYIAIIVINLICYYQSLDGDFVFDDSVAIIRNRDVYEGNFDLKTFEVKVKNFEWKVHKFSLILEYLCPPWLLG